MFEFFQQKYSPLISLIIKEFHSVWRDKKSRTVIFLPPVLQLFIFSYAATLKREFWTKITPIFQENL